MGPYYKSRSVKLMPYCKSEARIIKANLSWSRIWEKFCKLSVFIFLFCGNSQT